MFLLSGWIYESSNGYELPLYMNGILILSSCLLYTAVVFVSAPIGKPTVLDVVEVTISDSARVDTVIYTTTFSETTRL